MNLPTLTVVMCNYNHAYLMRDQIQAVLAQIDFIHEIIIVDDKSTDNSLEVIRELTQSYSKVRVIENEQNMGVIKAGDVGLDHATGDYVYWASMDDRVLPGFFEKSLSVLAAHPDAGLCFSDPAHFHTDPKDSIVDAHRLSTSPAFFKASEMADLYRSKRFFVHGHTAILNRKFTIAAGKMIPEFKWYCDFFLNCVMIFRHGACYVPEGLASFRIDPKSYSGNLDDKKEERIEVLRDIVKALESDRYRDVQSYFKQSLSFAVFGTTFFSVLFRYREGWSLVSVRFFVRVLMQECRTLLSRLLPSTLKLGIKKVLRLS